MYRFLIISTLFAMSSSVQCASPSNATADKALYEVRTYETNFRANTAALHTYLDDVLAPALKEVGVDRFMKFKEYGMEEPGKVWVIISYPSADIYMKAQTMTSSDAFLAKSQTYDAIQPDRLAYTRFESSLLLAFDGMPEMRDPIDGAGLFELRIYEGYSEDAVRRKISMFNDEEIALFDKVGLHMVFFGDMISGPHRPNLVYMLGFKDMAERDANWKTFIDHPEWKRMVADPKYANTVSNIRKVFLTPM